MDDIKKEVTEVAEPEVTQTDTGDSGKTQKDAEIESLIEKRAKELTNHAVQERLRTQKEKFDLEKQQAIEDALKKERMTEEERKNAEREELMKKYEELEGKYLAKERSELITRKLSEAGIQSDDLLVSALSNNIDNLDSIIEKLNETISSQVDKKVQEKLKLSDVKLTVDPGLNNTPRKRSTSQSVAAQIGVVK